MTLEGTNNMTRRLLAIGVTLAIASFAADDARAQCAGGTRGSNGLIPVLTVSRPVASRDVLITVSNVSDRATGVYVGYSLDGGCRDYSASFGSGAWLWPQLTEVPGGRPPFTPTLRLGATTGVITVSRKVPARWADRHVYIQAFVADPGAAGGFAFSGGQRTFVRASATDDGGNEGEIAAFLTLPLPQASMGGVRDPRTGRLYLFGEEIVEVDPEAPFENRIRTTLDRFPSARTSVASFWDPTRNVAVLLGGSESATRTKLTDVFEFDPTQPEGRRLVATNDRLPSPLSAVAPVFHPELGVALLFGGVSSTGQPSRLVAQYDPSRPSGSRVTALPDLLPTGSFAIGPVYEPARRTVLLFGLGMPDVFEFDIRRAEGSRFSTFDTVLPARMGSAVARDDASGRIYLFGGWTGSAFISHVVEFDPNAPAGARSQLVTYMKDGSAFGSALYDPDRSVVYAFGGSNNAGILDQILEFDAPGDLRPLGGFPEDMIGAPSVHAATTGKTYAFGTGIYEIDMAADFGREVRATSDAFPSVRLASAVAWDAGRGVAYVFGGRNPSTGHRVADVYQFDPSAPDGSRLTALPDSLPEGLSSGAAVYSPRSGVVYVFGGVNSSGRATRTILRFDPAAAPGARISAIPDLLPVAAPALAAVWDDGSSVAYLMGDGTSWIHAFDPAAPEGSRITVKGQLPSDRTGVAAALDAASGVVYVVGGWNPQRTYLDEVVKFDPAGPDGRQTSVVDVLNRPRGFATAVYDRFRGDVLVIAGDKSGNDIASIRTLR